MKLPFLDTKINLNTHWLPAPHLTWKIKDGETVIVDSQEGKVYHFNGSGAVIWDGVAKGLNGNRISELVAETFEAPEKKILSDVVSFLSQLRAQDLIHPAPDELP